MGVKRQFSYGDIEKALNKDLINIEKGLIAVMKRVGEGFVNDARDGLNIHPSAFPKGDYQDQTSNLRSSIAYFILRDNQIVSESVKGAGTGTMRARVTLGQIGSKRGYRLVGVAGMEYASALESKGYNVITSQQETCLVNLGERLQKFTRQIKKKGIDMDFGSDFTGVSSAL